MLLGALLLATAQPAAADAQASTPPAAAPAAAADADSIFVIFESVCLSYGETPAGFEAAAWSDFPPAVRLLNTYGHSGTFFRRADPETWMTRTSGEGHMMPGMETRCGIAARGIEKAAIVDRLRKRARAEESRQIGGGAMTLIVGPGGIFDVTEADDGWVIVRTMEILIRVDPVAGRKRKRKGD
jgi:hypothetical protein